MSTRTLTPNDPHAPRRERARFLPWSFLVALVLAPVLLAAGITVSDNGADGTGVLLVLLGVACGAWVLLGGPVYKWGPSGILFVLGFLIVIAGFAGAVGTRVAEEVTITMYDGDDDGDGRVDEDDFGDADNSENDPTQIDGLCELQDPEDDDSDCSVDEDPAPVYQTRSEVRTALAVSRELSIGAVILGLVILGAFAFVQNSAGRRTPAAPAEPAPPGPGDDAPTTTRRDEGER